MTATSQQTYSHGMGPLGDDVALTGASDPDPRFRAERQRLAQFEDVARFVVLRRGELGLSQRELADRMGTSHSAISRIESGQHSTSVRTLGRLAEALEARLVFGFESLESHEAAGVSPRA